MTKIKNFIYLDDYKMYSMSSQVFGGVVHSKSDYKDTTKAVSENIEGIEHPDLHKDAPASHGFGGIRHKHVHDYAYIDFENQLRADGGIVSLSAEVENVDSVITELNTDKFVEIRGKVALIDMNALRSTVDNFNKISKSLNNVVNYSQVSLIKEQMESEIKATKDRNEKAKIKQRMKSLINATSAKNTSAALDETYMKDLGKVLEYGFRDQFVIRISIGSYVFWAECDPDDLREKKDLLIRRFSRFPEPEFVIIGTISQTLNQTSNIVDDYLTSRTEESSNMKTTIFNLVQHLSAVESAFTGRLENEIIVDPIAIYSELNK